MLSKGQFQHRYEHIILPNRSRVRSLKIPYEFLYPLSLDLFPSLESLSLDRVRSERVPRILDHLAVLPRFSSLSIGFFDFLHDENAIYRAIFRCPKLKFCRLIFSTGGERLPLPLAEAPCPALECLIINGRCRLEQLVRILSYTPSLRYLFCGDLHHPDGSELELPFAASSLKTIDLIVVKIGIETLSLFLSRISSQVETLRVSGSRGDRFFQANQWQQLISISMPRLRTFDLHYIACIYEHDDADDDHRQVLIDQFSSAFWLEHQWLFDCQYFRMLHTKFMQVLSVLPHR